MTRSGASSLPARPAAFEAAPAPAALDRLAARALATGGRAGGAGGRAPWSDAAKDRLYRRMFPESRAGATHAEPEPCS